jgi:hypothetical protein
MRTELAPAVLAAILLLPVPSSRADVGCVGHRFSFVRNGTTNVQGSTRNGQPCQFGFGSGGSDIEVLRIVVKPSHGVLGASAKEGNRRYVAYAPSAGFIGRDRFEVFIQFTPVGGGSFATIVKVEMNVTP